MATITILRVSEEARFYQHRSNFNKTQAPQSTKHFNQAIHSIQNMKCIAVEKVKSVNRETRLRRELIWINTLKTMTPCGMNTLG